MTSPSFIGADKRQWQHQATDERVHDLLQAPPSSCPPAAPEPRQSNRVQDPRRVVVRARYREEEAVSSARFAGQACFQFFFGGY